MRLEFDIEIFHELLALCVVKHDLPFQFAEYDGVRNIFVYLNSNVKVLSRHTTTNDVLKMFKREKERMKEFFQSFLFPFKHFQNIIPSCMP